jgi:hypothetical protein
MSFQSGMDAIDIVFVNGVARRLWWVGRSRRNSHDMRIIIPLNSTRCLGASCGRWSERAGCIRARPGQGHWRVGCLRNGRLMSGDIEDRGRGASVRGRHGSSRRRHGYHDWITRRGRWRRLVAIPVEGIIGDRHGDLDASNVVYTSRFNKQWAL